MPVDRSFRFRSLLGACLALAVMTVVGLTAPRPATAQSGGVQRIAAVVNDDIISLRDLETRLGMMIASSKAPNTDAVRRQLLAQVMRGLIDERLKMQEAKRLGISVGDDEVKAAIRDIETNNNLPPGGLTQMLRQAGVPVSTLEDQMRAEVAWVKVVRGRLSRDLFVEEEEVDAVLETARRNLGKPEALLAEIVLTPDAAGSEDQARAAAERLVGEIRGGAQFPALARQFSSAATAASGGSLGWVTIATLEPELESVVQTLKVGEVSDPIRTTTGYTILLLRDLRTREAPDALDLQTRLSQLYMPTRGTAAVPEATRRTLADTLADASSCDEVDAVADEMRLPSSGAVGTLRPRDLPAAVRDVVVDLPENSLSRPIHLDDADVLVMVCERQNPDGLPSRQDIEQRLMQGKLERAANRALRDLRNAALIDIRL